MASRFNRDAVMKENILDNGLGRVLRRPTVEKFLSNVGVGIALVAIIDHQLPFEYTIASRSTDVMVIALPVQNINHSAFRSMFEREKLSGNNFNGWFRQLKLVLRVEKKQSIVEQPLPAAPAADSEAQVLAQRNAYYDAYNEKQDGVERFDMIQTFHAYKLEEGKSVSSYVLKIKGYVKQLERLGYVLPQDISVGLILKGLTSNFAGFVRNYNMHNMGRTIVIMEYLVKIIKKARILELKRRNMKKLILTSYTPRFSEDRKSRRGKCEHKEIRAFVNEFRTTNELLFKESNNSLSELRFEVHKLLRVIDNALMSSYEVKGVTTRGGKTTSQDIQNDNTNVHIKEPLVVNHDKPVEPKEVLVENRHQKTTEPVVQPSIEIQMMSIPFPRSPCSNAKVRQISKRFANNKARLEEACTINMNERCSAVLLNKLPSKEKDPGSFTIHCDIEQLHINNALADLGASIRLEKSINQSDLESCESLGNKSDDDSGLEKPIRRIDSFNTPYLVAQGIVRPDGVESIEVDRAKIDVIAKLPYLTNVKGVRSFIRHAGFYRRLRIKKGAENLAADHLSRLENPDLGAFTKDGYHFIMDVIVTELTFHP
ncbi:hypothetical protein Tco_0177895 [Tanacetum coccineum]